MPPYYASLTALRGVAVLAVVVFHLCIAFRSQTDTPHFSLGWLLPVINQGWFGIDVFFLISGYGLAAKLAEKQYYSGVNGALSFARNRVWRIYPVYWLCCLAAVALAYASSRFNHLDWHQEFPGDLRGVLASALLIEPFTGTPPLLPIVTWTLNCEMGFYTIVMLGILTRPRVSDPLLICAAVLLAFAGMSGKIPVLGWLLSFWPQFVCGLLVFVAIDQRRQAKISTFHNVIGLLIIIGICAWWDRQSRLTVTTVLGLGLIAAWPIDGWLARQKPVRCLTWCGLISYPLFLLHVPVGSRVMNLGRRMIPANSAAFLLVIGFAASVAVVVAWAIHRQFAQPLNLLAKRQPSSAV